MPKLSYNTELKSPSSSIPFNKTRSGLLPWGHPGQRNCSSSNFIPAFPVVLPHILIPSFHKLVKLPNFSATWVGNSRSGDKSLYRPKWVSLWAFLLTHCQIRSFSLQEYGSTRGYTLSPSDAPPLRVLSPKALLGERAEQQHRPYGAPETPLRGGIYAPPPYTAGAPLGGPTTGGPDAMRERPLLVQPCRSYPAGERRVAHPWP